MLAELGHGGAGGQGIGRTDRGAAIAGGRRPLVAASRPVIALQAADVGIVGADACSIGATAACAPDCAPAAICCSRRTAWLPSSNGSDGAGLAGAFSW
ncbi:hypothetical protein G6F35_018163 [Rhizopus arrhizus]|nr:hypothetical protein G6F35_018163 [Rhizopus arrhizus]